MPSFAKFALRRTGLAGWITALALATTNAQAFALPLEILTPSLPGGIAGVAYVDTLEAASGTTPYTWSLESGALPPGLTIDSGTGEIAGTSTVAGTYAFIVRVEDAVADTATRAFSIDVVAGAPDTISFEQQPTAAVAGVSISPAVTVRVRDSFGNAVAGENVTLTLIGSGTLTGGGAIASDANGLATFGALSVDTAGTKQLVASSGALTPVTSDAFAITSGAAATLAFEQQPTAAVAGVAISPAVTVRVRDSFGNAVAGENVTLTLIGSGTLTGGGAVASDANGLATFGALGINREGSKQLAASGGSIGPVSSDAFSITCPAIALSPSTLLGGTVGASYADTVSGNGGAGPYTFAVSAGTLPTGLTLDSGTGEVSGTPSVSGDFSFTITATDADSCSGARAYAVTVCPVIDVAPPALAAASVGIAYADTLAATAGIAPHAFAVTSGALPAGLSLSGGGVLSGTPEGGGDFSFTVTATASNGCAGARPYALHVSGIPAAIANLAATRVASGNDANGTAKIQLTFTMPAEGTSVEVYRAPFGGYPRYDDAGGVVPPTPGYPPSAPWVLTAVSASGQTDEPATRDFYYYVAFVENAGGGRSGVSNTTAGTCNYALGDVSDGVLAGAGDNRVDNLDVSLLGANYGIGAALITSRGVQYLDVGPTTDLLPTSRPFTDARINFEDLIVFATNYGLVSAPALIAQRAESAARAAAAPERFTLDAPSDVTPGAEAEARIALAGAGRLQGFSVELAWNAAVVEPLETVSGGLIEAEGGVLLVPAPGTVDAALLGVRDRGITAEGEVARVRFRVLRAGDPGIRVRSVTARDAANRALAAEAVAIGVRSEAPARTLLLAPAPNPMQGRSALAFALAHAGEVDLAIYSVDGRRVRTLARGRFESGVHRLEWNGDDDAHRAVAPGVYFARFVADGERFTRTLVRLR